MQFDDFTDTHLPRLSLKYVSPHFPKSNTRCTDLLASRGNHLQLVIKFCEYLCIKGELPDPGGIDEVILFTNLSIPDNHSNIGLCTDPPIAPIELHFPFHGKVYGIANRGPISVLKCTHLDVIFNLCHEFCQLLPATKVFATRYETGEDGSLELLVVRILQIFVDISGLAFRQGSLDQLDVGLGVVVGPLADDGGNLIGGGQGRVDQWTFLLWWMGRHFQGWASIELNRVHFMPSLAAFNPIALSLLSAFIFLDLAPHSQLLESFKFIFRLFLHKGFPNVPTILTDEGQVLVSDLTSCVGFSTASTAPYHSSLHVPLSGLRHPSSLTLHLVSVSPPYHSFWFELSFLIHHCM